MGGERKKSFRAAIKHYLQLLGCLKKRGFLGSAVLYPLMGFDFFPALFSRVFGFNNRRISGHEFFGREVSSKGVAANLRRLDKNLNYLTIVDVKDLGLVEEELKAGGFFSLPGRKTLFLKGSMVDLFEKEWDPDTERYYSAANPLINARPWIEGLLKFFKAGDNVVAFDHDRAIIPLEACRKINFEPPFAATNPIASLPLNSGQTAVTTVYLPAQVAVYQIK